MNCFYDCLALCEVLFLFLFFSVLSDIKPQTEPVHNPFTKRQPYQPTSTSSSMMDAFLQNKATPTSTTSALLPQSTQSSSLPQAITTPVSKPSGPAPGQQNSSSPADLQASSPLPLQQHKLKQQKKRASITTKVMILQFFLVSARTVMIMKFGCRFIV